MATGNRENWREWVSLSGVLEQLPQHFQQGVDTANLEITCIASLPKHLILGTNVGLVYLAHLPTPSLMRLKCEDPLSPITKVETVSTVDEMIAAGSLEGTITIFQLPRVTCKPTSSDQRDFRGIVVPEPVIKRFTVGNSHRSRITSLTWSRNGMLLFCGDAQGVVSQIDINYQTMECTPKELLKENNTIIQLSYTNKLLAIATLERTVIYNLNDSLALQVGKKPRKQGLFGCLWSLSAPLASSVLYVARPGMRMWSSNNEGEVQQTHIIKDLPDDGQICLLEPFPEKPRKGEYYCFGILSTIKSYLVAYNPHWLFIADLDNSKICNYSGQFGRIIDVAVSEQEIYVLDGSRHITCLSLELPDIGERRPNMPRPAAFLESENLKELKSRIVSQGTDILGQIARIGSTVAAKVTEHAKPPIVSGKNITSPLQDTEVKLNEENPMSKSFHKSPTFTNVSDGREYGHQRSSSSGIIKDPEQRSYSPSLIPPRMVQSVSSFLPSLLPTPSLVKTFGLTPPVDNVTVPTKSSEKPEFEEIVTSAQIVAQEDSEMEPLVMRDKPKKKIRKKLESSSPMNVDFSIKHRQGDMNVLHSNASASSSPSCATPQSSSTEKSSPGSELLEEVSRQLNYRTEEGCLSDKSDLLNETGYGLKSENCQFEGINDLEGFDPQNVDTRTYEDFKSDIEKKESLLAEILDLSCLRMDHEVKSLDEKKSDDVSHVTFDREHSLESTGCSTPSTLKEQSPLPDSASNDFLEQYYRNNATFTSSEDVIEATLEKKESSNDSNSCSCSLASNDGCERLGSNLSEDRLSYGPPSGSSLVSLPGNRIPSMEGQDPFLNESSAMFIVTDSSEIADISWSYSVAIESHQYDQEEMPGGWVKHKLPSNVISISVSEKMVAFLDSHGCLFCKQSSTDSTWKKYKLAARATHIAQSPSGSVMWVLYGTNAYTVQIANIEALPTAKMTLAARNVSQLSVDEELTWYIRGDYQVCVLPTAGGRGPSIVSCEDFRLIKVVSYAKVIWGLTDKGQVVFRDEGSLPSPSTVPAVPDGLLGGVDERQHHFGGLCKQASLYLIAAPLPSSSVDANVSRRQLGNLISQLHSGQEECPLEQSEQSNSGSGLGVFFESSSSQQSPDFLGFHVGGSVRDVSEQQVTALLFTSPGSPGSLARCIPTTVG
ncbi:tectonin beta-propeller repeat-containing protein 2-like [Palaemon carinicauda]|uniref:tectonin beta-propeller repeat-containing protein 2-like n=1 Tax=Palaemon carinicauda TaxID=392227 RepID=UPI0035B66AA2